MTYNTLIMKETVKKKPMNASEMGKKGGSALFNKIGKKGMSKIGKKGSKARWAKAAK